MTFHQISLRYFTSPLHVIKYLFGKNVLPCCQGYERVVGNIYGYHFGGIGLKHVILPFGAHTYFDVKWDDNFFMQLGCPCGARTQEY